MKKIMVEICVNSEKILDFSDSPDFEKALCFGRSPREEVSASAAFQKPSQRVTVKQPREQCISLLCGSGSIWKLVANLREENVSFCGDLFFIQEGGRGFVFVFCLFVLAVQGAFQCGLEPVGLGEVTWKESEVPAQRGIGKQEE